MARHNRITQISYAIIPHMHNPKSREKCNIERMIIAYRLPMNLGNLLSHRNLNTNSTAYSTLKKLSNEIMMGKSTEDTAMELDGEGAANFEQLQDLIRKECDKRDCIYLRLEEKCNKLEQQVTKKDQKNMSQRGQPPNNDGTGASKKNKSNRRQAPNQPSMCPRSATANNPGQQNRRKS